MRGDHKLEVKEQRLRAFSECVARIIITKTKIAGFGLNWQHCGRQCIVSSTYSFEQLYQALRRSLRYGRRDPVVAHIIAAETEGSILSSLRQKQQAHDEMQQAMTAAMREHGLFRTESGLALAAYRPAVPMTLPSWLRSEAA